MNLARTIRFDESDDNVFERTAQPDEWAVSGAFEFSDWTEADLTGKARQAFANGWLGLGSWGRAALVAVTPITEEELASVTELLAIHFVERYGAPNLDTARPVAAEEIAHVSGICAGHELDTVMMIQRRIEDGQISEKLQVIRPLPPEDAPSP